MSARLTKADLAILERAFEFEINGALAKGRISLMPARSKRAALLAERGYLQFEEVKLRDRLGVMTIKGYVLTDLGRMTYCASCDEPPTPSPKGGER